MSHCMRQIVHSWQKPLRRWTFNVLSLDFFSKCFHHHLIITESNSDSLELILDRLTSLNVTSRKLGTKTELLKENMLSRGWYSLVSSDKWSLFLKILVFVGFGNGLTDKQSLVFGTAFTRNHLAATVYCQALMSLSCQRLPNPELTDFYWRAAKPLRLVEKSNFTYSLKCPPL